MIRSDHIVVLSDQNGDLVAHCPFKKKKRLFAALIKRKILGGCGNTSALLAIFTKVAVKDINKLSL